LSAWVGPQPPVCNPVGIVVVFENSFLCLVTSPKRMAEKALAKGPKMGTRHFNVNRVGGVFSIFDYIMKMKKI